MQLRLTQLPQLLIATQRMAVALVQRNRPLATDGATTVEVRVKNTSGAIQENVTLRNVLPADWEVVNTTAQGGGQVSQEQDSDGQPVVVGSSLWPVRARHSSCTWQCDRWMARTHSPHWTARRRSRLPMLSRPAPASPCLVWARAHQSSGDKLW